MGKPISNGKCAVCGQTFSKRQMTKHLQSCLRSETSDKAPGRKEKMFHLVVEGRGMTAYWLHLLVSAEATLLDLDDFLRDIWLECCGHLSAFHIGERTFSVEPDEDYGDESMETELEAVLSPGLRFGHEYDFGSTTELTLKVLSELEGEIGPEPVRLLAGNEPPTILCACGKPATQVCTQCIYGGEGWLCSECADKHKCGEEMLLPVVNSPRVGVCAYGG